MDTRAITKKRNAPRLQKRHRNIHIPNVVDGRWSKYDEWVRKALTLYIEYPEVFKPVLNPDGTPALDRNFRPRDEHTGQRTLMMKKGAVWMTRAMFAEAWYEVFRELHYAAEPANESHYRQHRPDGTARAEPSTHAKWANFSSSADQRIHRLSTYAHPMDRDLSRMAKDGRLIRSHRLH